MAKKTELHAVTPEDTNGDVAPISKPSGGFSLDKFKSKLASTTANVGTLQEALPHHAIVDARDFVRLHPNEETHWTDELCFVSVPIKGQNRELLHLIDEDLAVQYLPSGKVLRFRLALATKPNDVFFLCHVPSRNLDNAWNADNVKGCERAKNTWVELTSLRPENKEGYRIRVARDQDAFPTPKWPAQSLANLIEVTFAGHMIDHPEHPALLRLIGARQNLTEK